MQKNKNVNQMTKQQDNYFFGVSQYGALSKRTSARGRRTKNAKIIKVTSNTINN